MAGTEILTGARYPTTGDAASIAQYFQNLANDLAKNTSPSFSSASARDTAFSTWVAQGNTMRDGLHCFVSGLGDQTYVGTSWVNDAWTNLSLVAAWSAYVGVGGGPGGGPYDGPGVRRVATSTGQLRGWINTAGAGASAGTGILSTVMSTTFRPSKPRSLMVPWETAGATAVGVTRLEVYTDGQIYTIRGIGSNTYLLLDNLRYDL